MPEIRPFKAYRYALPAKDLRGAVCPPYDIIGPELAGKLRKTPECAIHIELPQGGETEKYGNAKKTWNSWKVRGIVRKDPAPAFYVYEQVFKVKGKRFSRTGFFCELKVEEPGKGTVLRHELTLAGPKLDRLNLIRAMRVNTSPIFGLLADPKKSLRGALAKARRQRPLANIKDSEGVAHRLWDCKDAGAIDTIRQAARDNPVLIADGHHRYETSWNYFSEMRKSEGSDGPSSRLLFFICPLEDPGLVVFPTHRVLKAMTLDDVMKKALNTEDVFQVRKEKKPAVPKAPFFAVTDGKRTFSLRLKNGDGDPALFHLHSFLLPEMKKEDFIYTHDDKEALALAKRTGKAAILVPPVSVAEMNRVVRAGRLMPQKSTYFYPKIITGLVFRALDP